MLPLRILPLTLVLCFLTAPARAIWTESGQVDITILTPEITAVEAANIPIDADLSQVVVGTVGALPQVGTVTVLSEQGIERQDLGHWIVLNGTGNVQSTYGAADVFSIGTLAPGPDAVLDILNSDVTGFIDVVSGTLRVHAASSVVDVQIRERGTAYVSEGSTVRILETHEGSLVQIDDSFVRGACKWEGTVRAENSSIGCTSLRVQSGGVAEIGLHSLSPSLLTTTGNVDVNGGDLSTVGAIATTGSITARGQLDVAGGTWTNAGILTVQVSGVGGSVAMRIHGGAQFHQNGLVRVSGDLADDQLVVTGDGTLLEVDQDLRLGEFVFLNNPPQSLPGKLTVGDGAILVVYGTFKIGAQAVLNLNAGGTIYAAALDDQGGTINHNGGELIVPEPGAVAELFVAIGAVAFVRRGRS